MGFLPIDPRLDPTTGAFAALAGMPNAAQLKPAAYSGEPLDTFWGKEDFQTMSVAAKLGVTPSVDIASAYNSWLFTYDAMAYAETKANPPNGGLIFATRWGAGFRMTLRVWDFDAKAGVSLGIVAASAELGIVNASFEIAGFGFSNPDVLNLLPGPGRFDRKNYQRILDAGNAIQKYLKDHAADPSIKAVPFQVLMATPASGELDAAAHSVVFAMRAIADDQSLAEALESENASRFDRAVVKAVYAKHATGPLHSPTDDEESFAEAWLKFEKI
jgi:hypothetical protein